MTSIEYVFEQLEEQGLVFLTTKTNELSISISASDYLDIKRLAKQKEKQQILDAHGDEQSHLQDDGSWRTVTSEQYYNETYGSKGSDEPSEVKFWVDSEKYEQLINPTSSQTEISDEEIEKWAEKYGFRVPYDGSNNFYDNEAIKHYINGAKMYREQLKKKQ